MSTEKLYYSTTEYQRTFQSINFIFYSLASGNNTQFISLYQNRWSNLKRHILKFIKTT